MATQLSELPKGQWLHIGNLPLGITNEQLSEFLRSCYLDIPPECCSVRDFGSHATAFISVTADVVAELVNWAIGDATLHGHGLPVRAELSKFYNPTKRPR